MVSSILVATGIVLLASCVTHMLGFGSRSFFLLILEVPGQFLYNSFHLAGFTVPLFFLAAGILVIRPYVRPGAVAGLNLSLLPFLTLSLSLRLLFRADIQRSPATRLAAERFTPLGGAFFFLVLSLVLVVLIRRVALWLNSVLDVRDDSRRRTAAAAGADSGDDPFEGSVDGSVESVDDAGRAGTDAVHATGAPLLITDGTVVDDAPGLSGTRDDDGVDWTAPPVSQMVAESLAALRRQSQTEDPVQYADSRHEAFDEDQALYEAEVEFVDEDVEAELLDEDVEDEASDEVPILRFSEGRFSDVDVDMDMDMDMEWDDADDAPDAVHADSPRNPSAGAAPGKAPRRRRNRRYQVPIDGILDKYADVGYWVIDDETRQAAEMLRVTLEEFQIQAEVTGIRKGPVITMFEILPAPGVKLAKITNLADNIALRLAAQSVRIVAPIPGKHAVGIEIPNRRRNIVSFGELLQEETFRNPKLSIPIALGKDIPGDAQIVDLARTPHLLIAGATGSGKSVCVNSIICSVLYRRSPREVRMMLIDPKIVELKFYNDIPHLLTPVITDPKRAFQALQWCIYEMERRYSLLDSLAVRDVRSYNAKVEKRNLATEQLPYIVVVIDEFADLMQTSGKELESTLARLAAMSRAVGIHLVLATQRPSTDVITGLIKANIPSRIAFMVSSKVDSRIILDAQGAEKLLGQGDMLFTSAWDPFPTRMQGAFLSEEEVERVVDHVKTLGEPEYIDDEIFIDEDDEDYIRDELEDPLMEKAIEIVVSARKASASYLQRRLKIGYNRAARLVEEMERIGIVGPQNGSKPRDIIGAPN